MEKKNQGSPLDKVGSENENYVYDRVKHFFDVMELKKSKESNGNGDLYKNNVVQWGVNGRAFLPIGNTVNTLPAGWYTFRYNNGTFIPEILPNRVDELIKLPMPEYDAVLSDMQKFWSSEEAYRKYGFPYTRGILLYGPQGTGKTGLVRLLADELIKKDGLVFNVGNPDNIYAFESVFSLLRDLEPDRKVIVVLEDIDNFVRYGGGVLAKLLNILDGGLAYDNIVFLATTNYPESLIGSISNRPSRFDRRYLVSTPGEEARKVYIKTKFKELSSEEVDKLAKDTKGFTLDMLKETVLSIYVLGYKYEDVLDKIKELFTPQREPGSIMKGYDALEIYNTIAESLK